MEVLQHRIYGKFTTQISNVVKKEILKHFVFQFVGVLHQEVVLQWPLSWLC